MNADHGARGVRATPVILTSVFAVAFLKATGLLVSFSEAGAQAPSAASDVSGRPPAPMPPASAVEERMLEQLSARKAELDAREAELTTREGVIEAAELRLAAAIRALQQEKDAITLAETERVRSTTGEIGALSNAYERMKARDAARIFEVLDDDILIPVAAGMRTQSLAAVLAEMSSERAKALTIALANREAETGPAIEERL